MIKLDKIKNSLDDKEELSKHLNASRLKRSEFENDR